MSTLKMDPFQQRAVDSLSADILVSASAGAGKTRVLVERMMKRITVDHISIQNIVAVTFTKAAAAEMKERVALRLNAQLKEGKDRQWIEEQAALLDQALITTIDSLCLTIIQKYYTVIGLNPALPQNVLSGATENRYKTIAFERAFHALLEEHNELTLQVLKTLSPRPEDTDTLKHTVFSLMAMALRQPDALAWLDRGKTYIPKGTAFRFLPEELLHDFFLYYKTELEILNTTLDRLEQLAEYSEKLSLKLDTFQQQKNYLEPCFEAIEREDYDYFIACYLDFYLHQVIPGGDKEKDKEYNSVKGNYYNRYTALFNGLYSKETLEKDLDSTSDILGCLYDLTKATIANYQEIKRENACMDFNDMGHFARSILIRDNNAVAKLYQSQFKEVMVDEFQDTSRLQNEILELLAKGGTIFRVGDVKQSIYRFRGAEPSLMRTVAKNPETEHITLKYNYRSKENIVAFSNTLFSKVMNIEGLQDAYVEEDIVAVGSQCQKETAPNPVQMILVDDPSDDAKNAKAKWIAREILKLHREGQPFHHFAVLVRSHEDKRPLQRAFDEYHLPYDIDLQEGFFNSDICMFIRALISYLYSPQDEISLLTCLVSDLFKIDDDTLAQYKIRYSSLTKALYAERKDILDVFSLLKTTAEEKGILAFLDQLSYTNHFYESLSEPDKANFDALYEQAILLSKNGAALWDLKEEMENGSEEKSSSATYLGNAEDVITVTTIHQSKGLQYNTVFLLSSGSNPYQEKKETVTMNPVLYAGMKYCDPDTRIQRNTVWSLAIQAKDNQEDIEEYNRLLYVALTRAEEKMYIVDIAKNAIPYSEHLQIGDLLARKGITGIVLRSLKESDGFIIRKVFAEETEAYQPETSTEPVQPIYFRGTVKPLPPLVTPSAHSLSELPDLDFSSSQGSDYGTRMHAILAKLPDTLYNEELLKPYELTDREKAAVLAFGTSSIYKKALTMEIHKEMPFYVESDERMIGVMDFVAISSYEILLIDYKTDALPTEEIKARYIDQLSHYTWALNHLYPGIPVTAYIYSLHHQSFIEL